MVMNETQLRTYRSYITVMTDSNQKDENKLQAAQEINDNLELIMNSPYLQSFLEHMLRAFTRIIIEGQPQYISENGSHKIRKIIFEIIYRIPHNEYLRAYVDPLMTLCVKVLAVDNEEIVLVGLRIITELLKNYRPNLQNIIHVFTQFSHKCYSDLPEKMDEIFIPKISLRLSDIRELDLDSFLVSLYYPTSIEIGKGYNISGSQVNMHYTILPKGYNSLKVLQELPTLLILLYQMYRDQIKQDIQEVIPVVINVLCLKPSPDIRSNQNFSMEIYVEFLSAQVKTLSFIAYVIKVHSDYVAKYAPVLIEGLFSCFNLCPKEVTSIRRDLIIGLRHILGSELRIIFVNHMNKIFDEDLILKNGFTTNETLRPLAYSTIADFVHHVRQHLSMGTLLQAVKLFTVILHDESLSTSIQTVAAKLLLNVAEYIKNRTDGNSVTDETVSKLLVKITKVFVLKFKALSSSHVPYFKKKGKLLQQADQMLQNIDGTEKFEDIKCNIMDINGKKEKTELLKMRFGHPIPSPVNYTIADTKALIKALVCGIKLCTHAILLRPTSADSEGAKLIKYYPLETKLYMRFIKYACAAFEIYLITSPSAAGGPLSNNNSMRATKLRSKDDLDVFDHFNGVFTVMPRETFRAIFETRIEDLIEQFANNHLLFMVNEALLSNKDTCLVYGTILLEHLLSKMKEMGEEDQEKSNLYLKLFKSIFDTVSNRSTESESLLRPHLSNIVNRSIEYSLTAKEPFNYFVLLRALFRSIGGGNHDLLYQEFLPLLPTLLQNLNLLQSGSNKQQMKDMFVELCLTVPVRLSSLLPYLPMLMDPLVSAFNGSPTLISQGLRTLELCVDNLQPDFFYDHIQPIRADLMQALWRSLHNPNDQVANVAFRVLAKLGGGNRKMIQEQQCLKYTVDSSDNPEIIIRFINYPQPITLGVRKIIETIVAALKSPNSDSFYRQQCWEVLRGFLISSIDMNTAGLHKFLLHPSFTQGDIPEVLTDNLYKCGKTVTRSTHLMALTGMFIGILVKELTKYVIPTMVAIVRHYTMVAIAQQAGPFCVNMRKELLEGTMDPLVLIDAIAVIMGCEEKDLCKPGQLALTVIVNTANSILGSRERASKLPLMEYMVEKLCGLCFERPWFAKLGGCMAIKFLCTKMEVHWVFKHVPTFVKAQLFVMMDLYGEVSNGAVDQAKVNLREMIKRVAQPIDPTQTSLLAIQKTSLSEITYDLTRQITSSNDYVRKEAVGLLRLVAEIQGKQLTKVIESHKQILVDMIHPRKYYLRHQSVNAQVGVMEGTAFCTSLNPRLFSIDLLIPEHKMFFQEVCHVCESTDATLTKLPCYKSVTNFTSIRKAAMKVLGACSYVPNVSEKIFTILYQCLDKPNTELQQVAFDCLKKFLSTVQLDLSKVHEVLRPLLTILGDHRNITSVVAQKLCYVVQLFPGCFKEKLCDQLMSHMKLFFTDLESNKQTCLTLGVNEVESVIIIMLKILYLTPISRNKLTEVLIVMNLQYERRLNMNTESPFKIPLLEFLSRFPVDTVSMLIQEKFFKDHQYTRCLINLLKHEDGAPFRDVFNRVEITDKLYEYSVLNKKADNSTTLEEKMYMRYTMIQIMAILTEYNENWLADQKRLVTNLIHIWTSNAYFERWLDITVIPHTTWNEAKLVVKILLAYFSLNIIRVDLLFYLMCAFSIRMVLDFQFLKDFLEEKVCKYSVEWKRSAFLRYCDLSHMPNFSEDLKVKILQYIIIPCFTVSFESGEAEKLIVGVEKNGVPDVNLVTVFLTRMIEKVKRSSCSDTIIILLQQMAILIVQHASHHLAGYKTEENKLRVLMEFVWPCLNENKCVDSIAEYHGYLLLSHIISKMAINKKIILQVFRGLLKANSIEVRNVVRQGLDLLAPVLPTRMDDGYLMLAHWTKKIIIEEGHCPAQLTHVLSFIVRQYKVYYPVRHRLIHHLVNATSRLNLLNSSNCEYRKLSVDIAEVVIKWELMRIRDDGFSDDEVLKENMKRLLEAGSPPQHRKKFPMETGAVPVSSSSLQGVTKEEIKKPLECQHTDNILNYLIKLPCMINEIATTGVSPTGNELLARRCVNVIKTALKSDIWPHISTDLKLTWMDKHLTASANNSGNAGSVCVALEIVTLLINSMQKEESLTLCKMLRSGIIACISSTNPRVIRHASCFLSRLISIFPIEPPTSSVTSTHEELDVIYACIIKTIMEGLSAYERIGATGVLIYCPLILLKAGCANSASFVDRFSSQLVRVVLRLTKEYTTIAVYESIGGIDLLISSLDMLKNRVSVMKLETRKMFISTIITGLIETTTDAKIMRAICKILEEWVHTAKDEDYCGPNMQEKSVLLVKMIVYIEKASPDLIIAFLDVIHHIYREELAKPSELLTKLEQAFLAGLRSKNPTIRCKFFELLDNSLQRKLIYRLLYIVSSQNWERMGHHYWIKQALELILVTVEQGDRMVLNNFEGVVPSITSVIEKGSDEDQKQYQIYFETKEEPLDVLLDETESEIVENVSSTDTDNSLPIGNNDSLSTLIKRQQKFFNFSAEYKTCNFLKALAHLCHANTLLTESTWLHIFSQVWGILPEAERSDLVGEIPPFIASGIHVAQKDAHPSAVCTFYEGLAQCTNPVIIKPHVMLYMAKNHNLWHRVALTLEKAAIEYNLGANNPANDFAEWDNITQQEIVDSLADLYDAMSEEDMMCGLWQKHAKFTETIMALTYEQQGCFERALGAYEMVIGKARQTYANVPSPVHLASEQLLWEKHWIRCSKELNQWDHLLDYAQTIGHSNSALILDSAWRVPDWILMKEALSQVDVVYPGSLSWKVDLYKGYIAVCHPNEKQLHLVERLVEQASLHCIREWRRLPRIVSTPHIKILQAAQQIIELQEAFLIHDSLLSEKTSLSSSVHDMKAIVKTWRNRLPVIGDDLSHWSDIFTWRQHHYQFITTHFEKSPDAYSNGNSILGVHASAQAIIHFGNVARKHNLCAVCLDSLTRLYTMPSVPIVDCFQKILQQVKCYQQMSLNNGRNELQEGLDAIEYTNVRYLTREMTAECYALKGMLLSQMGNLEDANKSFSTALQLHDTLVKGWALWGDFMENQFVKSTTPDPMIGCSAILCFLNACKHQNESKARKYIAKVVWLITYDNEKCTLTELLDKHSAGIPPSHWLPWVPQLLTCLARKEGTCIINLISQIGRLYPQAIYFPTRTLYFTHKIEQRERFKTSTDVANKDAAASSDKLNMPGPSKPSTSSVHYGNSGQIQLKASHAMVNCSKIMQMQREVHPTILLSLEGIVDQMVWFREHWSEEVLRQLRLGLAKSYALAFENRGSVIEANISTSTHNFMKKLVSTFGTGLEMFSNSSSTPFSNAGSESLARRRQMTMSDPIFQKMKQQFADDFDFNIPAAKKLHNFISKLRKWIRILEKQVEALPKSFRMEEKCRFLINFSSQTAEIELPGEFLLPKHSHYYVRIARFVPRIEVVEKHNMATRRLYIRGHNGKIYPYLIMQESAMADARREETILQLMRMLNHYLTKHKETSRRGLMFNIPRVVAVSPQLRLVEDNLSSISLLDIYRRVCKKREMQYDEPVIDYYEKLALLQAKGGQTNVQFLKEILREIQMTNVPPYMFKQWASETYKSPTDYWMLRKILTLQISLSCFVEYVFHLTRMNPDMIYLHQDSGYLNISYFKFDVDDVKGEVDANRAVPFRLTPNLTDFITEIGVSGPLIASMIATAKCFAYPNFQVQAILKALLRDEMIAAYKRKQEENGNADGVSDPESVPGEAIIIMVTKSVTSMMARLTGLTIFDGLESKVETLVTAARSVDNLCRMDPNWHPWL